MSCCCWLGVGFDIGWISKGDWFGAAVGIESAAVILDYSVRVLRMVSKEN